LLTPLLSAARQWLLHNTICGGNDGGKEGRGRGQSIAELLSFFSTTLIGQEWYLKSWSGGDNLSSFLNLQQLHQGIVGKGRERMKHHQRHNKISGHL